MYLDTLNIFNIRNLTKYQLQPHPKLNIFYGPNGGGKTSILEAIYILSTGKSFRSAKIQSVISYHNDDLVVNAQILTKENKWFLGVKRFQTGDIEAKCNGEKIKSLSLLALMLPAQVICPESFRLLIAPPQERRSFLDWGVFHVEREFAIAWSKFKKALLLRNTLLKNKGFLQEKERLAWDYEFVLYGEQVSLARKKYVNSLLEIAQPIVERLLPGVNLEIELFSGWDDTTKSLEVTLKENLLNDLRAATTLKGPHRSDLSFKINKIAAGQVLSRGQQKRLICALFLAQIRLFIEKLGRKPIFLIDDLSSELDAEGVKVFLEELSKLEIQTFITTTEHKYITNNMLNNEYLLFAMEPAVEICSN